MTTPSNFSIRLARAELLSRASLTGASLRTELTDLYDGWLADLLPASEGIALVAVGGLGRREPTAGSDLDLVLIHDGKRRDIAQIADSLWYPVWDCGVGLDHSVRTVDQALSVANEDLKAHLGLLDARHIAGDATLSAQLREQVVTRWRQTAATRLPELQDLARSRWKIRGDASFLLEPDLKDCRGGLRDWVGLRALASAQLLDLPPAAVRASTVLLDVRGELHRNAGRAADVLRGQDRSAIASALGYADGDETLAKVNEAARAICYATDAAWRRVAAVAPASRSWLRRIRPGGAPVSAGGYVERTPLAKDVVSQGGEVVLARDAAPASDPVLVLRVARAAAENDLPISTFTLNRLAAEAAPLGELWPAEAREEFVSLLGAGERCIPVLEALDQHGLLSQIIPEWDRVRYRAQHNPVHLYTVDRHLIAVAVAASALTAEVSRPDLLLVGSLLHDIGKGAPGDHSLVGAELAQTITTRMGFAPADVAMIYGMGLHHLLLPDTATRRDLSDPSTIRAVITAVDGNVELLNLLHALAIADAAGTGPAAWSDWKGALIRELVRRSHAVLGGEPMPVDDPLPVGVVELAERREVKLVIDGDQVMVTAPDASGLLSRTAGLLALHSLDVHSADVRTTEGMAVNRFTVVPRFGSIPDLGVLNADLRRVLAGSLDVHARLLEKEAVYNSGTVVDDAPRLLWFDDVATDASVFEVRTHDRLGLLHQLTSVLESCGVDIRSARISSLGSRVVDAFYLTDADGKPLQTAKQTAITVAVRELLNPSR